MTSTRFAAGEFDAAGPARAEDDAIRDVIHENEGVALQAVSYGEFRRNWWHCGFLDLLIGVDEVGGQSGMRIRGAAPAPLATGTKPAPLLGRSPYVALVGSRTPR